jgi:integrase
MARKVRHAELDSRTARSKLKRGRQAHWKPLSPDTPGIHLGYQRQPGASEGRWLLRRYLGGGNRYQVMPIGLADDTKDADGRSVLDHAQAGARARAMAATGGGKIERITVRQAFELYIEHKSNLGQNVSDVTSRANVHILPELGDEVVSQLTPEPLRKWLRNMAAAPGQVRPTRDGKPQYRAAPKSDEDIRKRRSTANRTLTVLKACLNYAYDEGHVSSRDAWGRKLKPFAGTEMARIRYLQIAEAQRLINASDPEFRPLVRAALETGARYSELARCEVTDFNPDSGSLAIRKSKTGKARHIILTEEGSAFFRAHCAGRSGSELMFTHNGGNEWRKGHQTRPMKQACERAKLKPPIGFHQLRHTWASLAVMAGMPLMVVARNLGHVDTKMVEKHYGHLAPSFIVDAIRSSAPRYGIKPDKKIVPLK